MKMSAREHHDTLVDQRPADPPSDWYLCGSTKAPVVEAENSTFPAGDGGHGSRNLLILPRNAREGSECFGDPCYDLGSGRPANEVEVTERSILKAHAPTPVSHQLFQHIDTRPLRYED